MSWLFSLPNEILIIILSYLDPFKDFPNLVHFQTFKPLINHDLCVFSDNLQYNKNSPFNIIEIEFYKDVLSSFKYFMIDVHIHNVSFLLEVIKTLVLYNKLHVVNIYCWSLSDHFFFDQGVFEENGFTKEVNLLGMARMGSPDEPELFSDVSPSFKLNSDSLVSLCADFKHRKSHLRKFNLPNLKVLHVSSSHLSSRCIQHFTKLEYLGINGFSDLEDLTLTKLTKIKLCARYSLMLSNCNFPSLKSIEVDSEARLPGMVNCRLDSLVEFSAGKTKTSYIKSLICPNLKTLGLVHTLEGVLNTLVFEGGSFPKLSSLAIPSPIYLLHFENSYSNLEYLTTFIQKKWFYPTLPMHSLQDDSDNYSFPTILDELDLLAQTSLINLRKLTIIVENLKLDNELVIIPNLMVNMPKLTHLELFVTYNEDIEEDYVQFDITFLKDNPLYSFRTNVLEKFLIGHDSYQINDFYREKRPPMCDK